MTPSYALEETLHCEADLPTREKHTGPLIWKAQKDSLILTSAEGYIGLYAIILVPGQSPDAPSQLIIKTPRIGKEKIFQEVDLKSPCFDAIIGRLQLLCEEQDAWLRTHGATSSQIPEDLDF